MLKRNSFNVHWKFGACQKWEPAGRIGDFGIFWTVLLKAHVCFVRFWKKMIEWVQFVLENCEILHFVWGLYDENSASYYCFTSDVMYKKAWNVGLDAPRFVGNILFSKLVESKKFGLICFPRIRFPGLTYCDQGP